MNWMEVARALGRAMAHADTRDPAMPAMWVKGWQHGTVDMFEYLSAELRLLYRTPAMGLDGAFEDAVYREYNVAIRAHRERYGS